MFGEGAAYGVQWGDLTFLVTAAPQAQIPVFHWKVSTVMMWKCVCGLQRIWMDCRNILKALWYLFQNRKDKKKEKNFLTWISDQMWSLAGAGPQTPLLTAECVQTLQPINTNYTDQALITLINALTTANAAAPALTSPACYSTQPTHIQYDSRFKSELNPGFLLFNTFAWVIQLLTPKYLSYIKSLTENCTNFTR